MKFILIMSALFAISAMANDGSIVFLRGQVELNGKEVKLKAVVNFGDQVEVKKNSLAIIKLRTGSMLKIKQSSQVKLKRTILDKDKSLQTYLLEFGEIFVRAKRTNKIRYRVKARDAVFGVRGTKFFVSREKKKSSVWMCVNKGRVNVSLKGTLEKSVEVKAGEGVLVNSNKLPSPKKYSWTKSLNWTFEGKFEDVNDTTDVRGMDYDLENFEYD